MTTTAIPTIPIRLPNLPHFPLSAPSFQQQIKTECAIRAKNYSRTVFGTAFCPESRYLVACASDGQLCVWDLHRSISSTPGRRSLDANATNGSSDCKKRRLGSLSDPVLRFQVCNGI